jgi:hypothetical protein
MVFVKKTKTTAATKVADKIKKYVKKAIKTDGELKIYPLVLGATFGSTGGVVASLTSGLQQGTNYINRLANEVTLEYMDLRFYHRYNLAGTNIVHCTVYVVQDMKNAGSSVTATDILQSAADYSGMINQTALINKRFRVLHESRYAIGPPSYSTETHKHITKRIKINRKATWAQSGAGVTGGQIYFLSLCSNIDGAASAFELTTNTFYRD